MNTPDGSKLSTFELVRRATPYAALCSALALASIVGKAAYEVAAFEPTVDEVIEDAITDAP